MTPIRDLLRMRTVKFQLKLQPLNAGGYTPAGQYFGTGLPLYYWCALEPVPSPDSGYLRAYSRTDAQSKLAALMQPHIIPITRPGLSREAQLTLSLQLRSNPNQKEEDLI